MAKVYNKTRGFESIPRDCVYDNELSDRARFLYVYMACKPDGWEFYQDKMAEEIGYKKDTLRKYLDELIVRGWITEKAQANDGKFGALEYVIEIDRKKGNLPIRKNTDTEKNRNGKIPNQRNIEDISSKHSLSDKRNQEKSEVNKLPSPKSRPKKKELSEVEVQFIVAMKEQYPRIMKMEQPLTYEQSQKLKSAFTSQEIKNALDGLENWKPLLTKRVQAYMTIVNWIKKDQEYGQ